MGDWGAYAADSEFVVLYLKNYLTCRSSCVIVILRQKYYVCRSKYVRPPKDADQVLILEKGGRPG